VASLVQSLTAGDKVAAISDATKDLHSAISKLEKVNVVSACTNEACCRRRLRTECVWEALMQRPLHVHVITGCGPSVRRRHLQVDKCEPRV